MWLYFLIIWLYTINAACRSAWQNISTHPRGGKFGSATLWGMRQFTIHSGKTDLVAGKYCGGDQCFPVLIGNNGLHRDQSELDKQIPVPGVGNAACFVFTSLQCTDHELTAMATHWHFGEFDSSDVILWKDTDRGASKMREKAKMICDLAEIGTPRSTLRCRISYISVDLWWFPSKLGQHQTFRLYCLAQDWVNSSSLRSMCMGSDTRD